MTTPIGPIGLSYPKHRAPQYLLFDFGRADNRTQKATLPKGAVVVSIQVLQVSDAATAAGAISVGLDSTDGALVNALSMATTAVGLVTPGTKIGTSFLTALTSDQKVTTTYTVGSSTAGGVGSVMLEYILLGPGEGVYD